MMIQREMKEEIIRLRKSIELIEDGPNYGTITRLNFLTNQRRELLNLEIKYRNQFGEEPVFVI